MSQQAQPVREADGPSTHASRYPENLSPYRAGLPMADARFADLRESILLDYGYNTARAYWSDLEHLNDWCLSSNKNILAISESDFGDYLSVLFRAGYSPNTLRRRKTAFRHLCAAIGADRA